MNDTIRYLVFFLYFCLCMLALDARPDGSFFKFTKENAHSPFVVWSRMNESNETFVPVDHVSSDARQLHFSIHDIIELGLECREVYFIDTIHVYLNFALRYICYYKSDAKKNNLHVISLIVDGRNVRIAEGVDMDCRAMPQEPHENASDDIMDEIYMILYS